VERERTALVLSAGGMFGAYQAGVWERLGSYFDPDIVVGASVGSLNGWRIACGCSPDDLSNRWLNLKDLAAVRWRIPSRLADGIIDNRALEAWIQEDCRSGTPSRQFGVVLTDVKTMKPVLFETPAVDWRHIATSCAVPVFLRHYPVSGTHYTDGGLVDPLPLRAALQMGATRIITVNLLKHRPLLVRAAVQGLRALSRYRLPDCRNVKVIDISPDARLGSARDSIYWSRDKARYWIEMGRAAADKAAPQVVEWLHRA
jgi:predicted acylesterase/phospholipase RssA